MVLNSNAGLQRIVDALIWYTD